MAEMTKEAETVAQAWPPLKKALWNVVTGAELNSPKYVNAYVLTDKLYAAALAATPPGRDPATIEAVAAAINFEMAALERDVRVSELTSKEIYDIARAAARALATPVMTEEL